MAACLTIQIGQAHGATYSLYTAPTIISFGSGNTVSAPTFNRPTIGGTSLSSVGNAVPYVTNNFTAPASGTYTFYVTPTNSNFDAVSFLYSGFSAAAPLANLAYTGIAHNTPPPSSDPLVFQANLNSGTGYQLLTTGYSTSPVSPATNSGPFTASAAYGGSLYAIPDAGSVSATLAITDGYLVSALNSVTIKGLLHHYASDLIATLSNGVVSVPLLAQGGGSADFLGNDYTFVQGGAALPTTGTIPASSYDASGSLASFAGQPLIGHWTLTVSDVRSGDVGTFSGFSLNITQGQAVANTWILDANGSWNSAANWSAGVVPNAPGAAAVLGNFITAPRIITLSSSVTVGTLTFSGSNSYTVASAGGSASLNLDASETPGKVFVSGQHFITSPLTATADAQLMVDAGSKLTLSTLDAPGTVTLTGGGTLAIGTRLSAATVGVDTASLVDLGRNEAVITGQTEAAVDALVATWLSTGRGLGSSAGDALGTLAVISNDDGAGGSLYSTFDGLEVVSGSVLVKYTYIGDTNLDGLVDARDLAHLLVAMHSNGALTGWGNGDTNYDGVVDNTDLDRLLASLRGQGAAYADPLLTTGVVPEPGMGGMIAGLAALACARPRQLHRWRR